MSRVTLRNTTAITIDLPVSRSHVLPIVGQAGQASFTLPYSERAATAAYINPDGGSSVVIEGGDTGRWVGIVTGLAFDQSGIEVTAHQPSILLSQRTVGYGTHDATQRIGQVALVALRESVATMPWFTIGPTAVDGGVALTDAVSFDYGAAWSILTSLMGMGDEELFIDAETGRIDWGGAFSHGTLYAPLLCEGGALVGVSTTVDPTARLAHVTARAGIDSYDAYAGEVAASGWPAQATVSATGGGNALKAAADSEMGGRIRPRITIDGSVTRDHAAIREGQFVRLLLTRHGFTGGAFCCRVMSRTVDDNAALIGVTFDVYDLSETYRPIIPAATSRDRVRPRGSIAGLLKTYHRRLSELERG